MMKFGYVIPRIREGQGVLAAPPPPELPAEDEPDEVEDVDDAALDAESCFAAAL